MFILLAFFIRLHIRVLEISSTLLCINASGTIAYSITGSLSCPLYWVHVPSGRVGKSWLVCMPSRAQRKPHGATTRRA